MITLPDRLRSRLADTSARLSDALAQPPTGPDTGSVDRWRHQSLSQGAAGVVVLHGVRARQQYADMDRVHVWLTRVAQEELSAGPGVGLWFGVPAVAFALLIGTPHHYSRAAADLDDAVRRLVATRLDTATARMRSAARPLVSEYDLVHGLTGLGAYLIRRHPHSDLTGRVLSYLVELTRPVPAADAVGVDAPGWWASDAPSPQRAHQFAGGHGNFGMAHGIAGPLALLSLAMRRGIIVAGQATAITTICDWLDMWRHESPTGPWWPEHITVTELRHRRSARGGPARPSWCYGMPGLARAQQLAGIALRDPARQHRAERALDLCLADQAQLSHLTDSTLCHGWAGLTATVWCAAADARSADIERHLPSLLDIVLRQAEQPGHEQPPGLVDGSAGVALTLHCIATGMTEGWERCLLLN